MGTVAGKEKKIASLFNKGYSVSAIARRIGVATTAVSQKLQLMGLRERHRQKIVSQDDRDKIVRRYLAGEPSKAISRDFSVTFQTVLAILHREGVQVNRRGNRYREFTSEQVAEMGRLWAGGMSQHAIGQQHGVSQAVVSRVLRSHGIAVAPRKAEGARHGSWKGGTTTTPYGYVLVAVSPSDPMSAMRSRQGYVMMHRLVMARSLGRVLRDDETVHHINGDRTDNRLENLQLRNGKHGKGAAFRCLDCGSCNVESVTLGGGTAESPLTARR